MTKDNAQTRQFKDKNKDKPGKRSAPRKITESYLHNAGLYYLQKFASSRENFRKVMTRKIDRSCAHHKDQDRNACIKILEGVIARLNDSGILDDKLYARGTAHSLHRKGLSGKMITLRLNQRGVETEDITRALQEISENTGGSQEKNDLRAAIILARRRRLGPFSTSTKVDEDSRNRKEMGAMARAGFDFETARNVLNMTRDEADQLLAEVS